MFRIYTGNIIEWFTIVITPYISTSQRHDKKITSVRSIVIAVHELDNPHPDKKNNFTVHSECLPKSCPFSFICHLT